MRLGVPVSQAMNRALIRQSMCYNKNLGGRVVLLPYGGGEKGICRLYRSESKCDADARIRLDRSPIRNDGLVAVSVW